MKKILIGLVAAIAVAAGGFFGFQFYAQHRITGEVEAAFEQIRASGGKASHGKVSFDLVSRTVTIADITGESATQPPVSVKIASIDGLGRQPAGRDAIFRRQHRSVGMRDRREHRRPSARRNLSYKMPRIIVKDYSGPAGLQRRRLRRRSSMCTGPHSSSSPPSPRRQVSVPNIAASINFSAGHVGRLHLFGHRAARHQGRQDRDHRGRADRLHANTPASRQARQNDRRMLRTSSRTTSMPQRPPPSSIRKMRTTTSIIASTDRPRVGLIRSPPRLAFACASTG